VSDLGKTLVILGAAVMLVGAVLWSGFGRGWLGRLPGDFHFRRGGADIYFPFATCILISVVLTLVSWIFRGRH
jgi:hypothetical protein